MLLYKYLYFIKCSYSETVVFVVWIFATPFQNFERIIVLDRVLRKLNRKFVVTIDCNMEIGHSIRFDKMNIMIAKSFPYFSSNNNYRGRLSGEINEKK